MIGTRISLWFEKNANGSALYLYNSLIITGDTVGAAHFALQRRLGHTCSTGYIINQTFSVVLTTTALATTSVTQSFTNFIDSDSPSYLCGPRKYELVGYTGTYLTLNTGPTTFSLVLKSLLPTDSSASPYSVIFKVSLLNYPHVFLQKTLNITIGQCVLTSCIVGSFPS